MVWEVVRFSASSELESDHLDLGGFSFFTTTITSSSVLISLSPVVSKRTGFVGTGRLERPLNLPPRVEFEVVRAVLRSRSSEVEVGSALFSLTLLSGAGSCSGSTIKFWVLKSIK